MPAKAMQAAGLRKTVCQVLPLVVLAVFPSGAWGAKKAKPKAAKASDKLPDFPKEPLDQQAARLWQAGELAASRGDYAWAVKQFEGCLKAEPKNGDCKAGLKEAKLSLGWNPKPKKKRKKAPKPPEEAEGPAAEAAEGAKAEGGEAAAAKPAAEGDKAAPAAAPAQGNEGH